MNILDNNYNIAVFMGSKYSKDRLLDINDNQIFVPLHGVCRYDTIESGKGKILEYHKSWDWLIPVIEKIEKQGCIIQVSFSGITNCKITVGNFKEPIITVANTESQDSMKAIYTAVIEYIKWYNNEKTN